MAKSFSFVPQGYRGVLLTSTDRINNNRWFADERKAHFQDDADTAAYIFLETATKELCEKQGILLTEPSPRYKDCLAELATIFDESRQLFAVLEDKELAKEETQKRLNAWA